MYYIMNCFSRPICFSSFSPIALDLHSSKANPSPDIVILWKHAVIIKSWRWEPLEKINTFHLSKHITQNGLAMAYGIPFLLIYEKHIGGLVQKRCNSIANSLNRCSKSSQMIGYQGDINVMAILVRTWISYYILPLDDAALPNHC